VPSQRWHEDNARSRPSHTSGCYGKWIWNNDWILIRGGKTKKNSERNLFYCHFLCRESHMKSPGNAPEALL
jgi:hypothetical protein